MLSFSSNNCVLRKSAGVEDCTTKEQNRLYNLKMGHGAAKESTKLSKGHLWKKEQ